MQIVQVQFMCGPSMPFHHYHCCRSPRMAVITKRSSSSITSNGNGIRMNPADCQGRSVIRDDDDGLVHKSIKSSCTRTTLLMDTKCILARLHSINLSKTLESGA